MLKVDRMVGVEGNFKIKLIIVIDLFPRTYIVGRHVSADVRSFKKSLDIKLGGSPHGVRGNIFTLNLLILPILFNYFD